MRSAPSSNAQLRFSDTRTYHLARVSTCSDVFYASGGGSSSDRNDLIHWIKMVFMSGCTREPLAVHAAHLQLSTLDTKETSA
jgi:hypothetical protein